jgi:hypothetical protein
MISKLLVTLAALGASAFAADTSTFVVNLDAHTFQAQFGMLNLADGSFFLIRNYGQVLEGIQRTPKGALVTVDNNGLLFRIEPETGYLTFVGASGVAPGGPFQQPFNTVGGMTDGRFFGIDWQSNLWQINTDTGKAMLIGNTGLPAPAADNPRYGITLAGDDKYLYVTLEISAPPPGPQYPQIFPAALYRVDPGTGVGRLIGPAPRYIAGTAYANSQLYAFSANVDDSGDNLLGTGPSYVIDPKNAAVTMLPQPAPCSGIVYGGVVALPGDSPLRLTGAAAATLPPGVQKALPRWPRKTDPDVPAACTRR